MGWQKMFTLSRRAKGCHLVTDEVAGQIQDGLKDVQVRFFSQYLFNHLITHNQFTGWDAIPLHVQCLSRSVGTKGSLN